MQKFLERAHFVLLLPSLIITMILVNQTAPIFIIIGQFTGWLSYIFAGLVVINSFYNKLRIYLFFLAILVSKVLAISLSSLAIETLYIVCQNILFCLAGTIIAFLKPNLLYRQVMLFCLMNLILMIFQVTGFGGQLSMTLTTHGEGPITPVFTLFKEEADLNYLLIQGRPAGLTQANIILSLIIIFAVAIHFSREQKVFRWGTVLLSSIITLSMAKIAYLGFVITCMIVIFRGRRFQKIRILTGGIYIFIFLIIYKLLFPGLASINLSKETIDASIFLRANDIMFALNPDFYTGENKPFFEGTSFFYGGEQGEFVSGIASLITKFYNNLSFFLTGLIILFLLYVNGLKKIKINTPNINLQILTVFVVIGMFPVTHPIWAFQIYWFMLGYGLLPFYFYQQPKFIETKK